MQTIHFFHPEDSGSACGVKSARATWTMEHVTCQRCLRSDAISQAREFWWQLTEREAQDAERRSLRGYDPQEVADRV